MSISFDSSSFVMYLHFYFSLLLEGQVSGETSVSLFTLTHIYSLQLICVFICKIISYWTFPPTPCNRLIRSGQDRNLQRSKSVNMLSCSLRLYPIYIFHRKSLKDKEAVVMAAAPTSKKSLSDPLLVNDDESRVSAFKCFMCWLNYWSLIILSDVRVLVSPSMSTSWPSLLRWPSGTTPPRHKR
jgi:hypothetical protein